MSQLRSPGSVGLSDLPRGTWAVSGRAQIPTWSVGLQKHVLPGVLCCPSLKEEGVPVMSSPWILE